MYKFTLGSEGHCITPGTDARKLLSAMFEVFKDFSKPLKEIEIWIILQISNLGWRHSPWTRVTIIWLTDVRNGRVREAAKKVFILNSSAIKRGEVKAVPVKIFYFNIPTLRFRMLEGEGVNLNGTTNKKIPFLRLPLLYPWHISVETS